jgi:hypothetical protein
MDKMLCPTCNIERDQAQFKRHASLSQTRSWLKNPSAQTRLLYTGKVCNYCHKRVARKPSTMSPEELRKRLTNEGKHLDIIEHLYAQRVKAGKKRSSQSGTRALKKRRAPLFEPVMSNIGKVIASIRSRRLYVQQTDSSTDDGRTAIEYLDLCLAQTVFVRDKLMLRRKTARTPPAWWQNLIPPDDIHAISWAYAALSTKYKDRFAAIHRAVADPVVPQVQSPINKGE